MLSYIDESGTPGVAISKNDWLIVAMVAFDDAAAVKVLSDKIDALRVRLGLPDNYEFHRVKDKLDIREKFERLIFKSDLKTYVFGIKKNRLNDYATFRNIAKHIITNIHGKIKITLDTNPILVKELNKAAKNAGKKGIRARELDSKKSNLLQVADYVANIASKCQKSPRFKPPTGYLKRLHFVLMTE